MRKSTKTCTEAIRGESKSTTPVCYNIQKMSKHFENVKFSIAIEFLFPK